MEEKIYEIKAIPLILKDLDLEGCVVSIDAIGCQKEIVKTIVTCDANYVIGVKDNQPTLASGVEDAFKSYAEHCAGDQFSKESTVDHGRIEGKPPTNPILSSISGCPIFTAIKIARTNGKQKLR